METAIENTIETQSFVSQFWDASVMPTLTEFISIPNKSPAFDANWEANGHMLRAATLLHQWCEANALPDMSSEIVSLPSRTPVLMIEIPGHAQSHETVLFYGHFDKQPEMEGWSEGLSAWQPTLVGDKLYGRGGADDGYAVFSAISAIKALHEQEIPHARCVILIEGCEESGSYDLPFYLDHLKARIGKPNLVVCLDSGCGNYDQLWATTSLRGFIGGTLHIDVLKEGVHSGVAGGIVPSTFTMMRELISRIEDNKSKKLLLDELYVDIPAERFEQADHASRILGEHIFSDLPFVEGAEPIDENVAQLLLNRTWRACLEVTGISGVPSLADAGNVLRPRMSAKLAVRIPPTCDVNAAANALKSALEDNPPYKAQVRFDIQQKSAGWNAPAEAAWLTNAINHASSEYFNAQAARMGEGGTIPFVSMLHERFPEAQFLVTGVLGPHSNAHGPNEFLHLPTAKRLTCAISHILANHHDSHH